MIEPAKSGKKKPVRLNRVAPAPAVVAAWQACLNELGRFPSGTRKSEASADDLTKILAKAEKGAIMTLRETFTQDRSQISKGLLAGKRQLVAYLLGFHLANAARLQITLSRLQALWPLKDWCQKHESVKVIDLGCGAGAMAQSWLAYLLSVGLKADKLGIKLIDGSQLLLSHAKQMLLHMDENLKVSSLKASLENVRFDLPAPGGLTIYSLGYVWNEMTKNRKAQQNVLRHFKDLVKHDCRALITIVEPATQQQSRQAMELRDQLVASGFVPLYPCPHAAPCPMLQRSRDWCYSEFDWRRPALQEYIDFITEADRLMLAASAYVFATPALLAKASHERAANSTVVGRPFKKSPLGVRRKFEYLLCEAKGELSKVPSNPEERRRQRGEKFLG